MSKKVAKKKAITISPFEVKQAIVGLELGRTDEKLLQYLQFFSERIPISALYFLHVIPKPQLVEVFHEFMAGHVDIKESSIQALQREVAKFMNSPISSVEFGVLEGNPLEELLHRTKKIKADLLIIGQKAEVRKHGILARKLARKTEKNTLIIPEKASAKISKILVPIDFSSNASRALQSALALQTRLDSSPKITCVNVYQTPRFDTHRLKLDPEKIQSYTKEIHRKTLDKVMQHYVPNDNKQVDSILIERRDNNTAQHILDYAVENDFDLIVIGARGHSRLDLLLLGSVTEKLLSINEQMATLVVK